MFSNNTYFPVIDDKPLEDYLGLCLKISRAARFNYAKVGSAKISEMTISLVSEILETSKWETARDLIAALQSIAVSLRRFVVPYDDVVMNIFKRILKIIRDTCLRITGKAEVINLCDVLKSVHLSFEENYLNVERVQLLPEIMDAINEMLTDLESSSGSLVSNAKKFIREDDVIMTIGRSTVMMQLLKEASSNLNFKVIVIQGCCNDDSSEIAKQLATEGIPTLIVPFTHIKAMLGITNKVIIGAKSLVSNGSIRSVSGTRTIAQLAKNRNIPVYVIGGLHKLFDHYPCSGRTLDEFRHGINAQVKATSLGFKTAFAFDYVPASLIDVIATNSGKIAPQHLYGIAFEAYHPDDCFI